MKGVRNAEYGQARRAVRVRTFSFENVRKASKLHQAFGVAMNHHRNRPADSAGEDFPRRNIMSQLHHIVDYYRMAVAIILIAVSASATSDSTLSG